MPEYNQEYFNKNDVKNGLHLEFIKFLLDKLQTDDYYLDIHLIQEDYGVVTVEWIRKLYERDDRGGFEYVDSDQYLVKKVELPDGHYDYARTDEDAELILQNWYKTHAKKTKGKQPLLEGEGNEIESR